MEGRNAGVRKEIGNAIIQYRAYLARNAAVVDAAWNTFEKLAQNSLLKKCVDAWLALQSVDVRQKVTTFKSQFYACLVADNSLLRGVISATESLSTAFERYNAEISRDFDWNNVSNEASIVNEYADFFAKPGNYLLPIELNIIAIASNITIHFYTRNYKNNQITKVVTYNPDQQQLVMVCFNGTDHFQRMVEKQPGNHQAERQQGSDKPPSLVAKSMSKMFAEGGSSGLATGSPRAANVAVVADSPVQPASPVKKA